jgi:hypothetical protein
MRRRTCFATLVGTARPCQAVVPARRRMDASVLLVKAIGGGSDVTELPKP